MGMFWHGNKFYRSLVDQYKNDYIVANNETKQQIAKNIIKEIRDLSPPGRFLEFDPSKHQCEILEIRRQYVKQGKLYEKGLQVNSCRRQLLYTLSKNFE